MLQKTSDFERSAIYLRQISGVVAEAWVELNENAMWILSAATQECNSLQSLEMRPVFLLYVLPIPDIFVVGQTKDECFERWQRYVD